MKNIIIDIRQYWVRKLVGGLVDSSLAISFYRLFLILVPVDDMEALCKDLKNDELVNRELTNFARSISIERQEDW